MRGAYRGRAWRAYRDRPASVSYLPSSLLACLLASSPPTHTGLSSLTAYAYPLAWVMATAPRLPFPPISKKARAAVVAFAMRLRHQVLEPVARLS